MSRHDQERLRDILDAIRAIKQHLGRGDLSDGLVYDAVHMRLVEIGLSSFLRDHSRWFLPLSDTIESTQNIARHHFESTQNISQHHFELT